MSYAIIPPPTQPQRRPGTVTAAGYLLVLMAVCRIVDLIVSIADRSRAQYYVTNSSYTIALVEDVVIAALWVAIAMGVLRGIQGWRVTAWVLTGLELLCGGIGLIVVLAASGTVSALGLSLGDFLPAWAWAAYIADVVIQLIAALLVIILLAVGGSNPYFAKATQLYGVQVGSFPEPTYPTQPYPGQPPHLRQPYPGQPTYPGQPYPSPPTYPSQPYPGQPYPSQPSEQQPPYPPVS